MIVLKVKVKELQLNSNYSSKVGGNVDTIRASFQLAGTGQEVEGFYLSMTFMPERAPALGTEYTITVEEPADKQTGDHIIRVIDGKLDTSDGQVKEEGFKQVLDTPAGQIVLETVPRPS